jgi:hypothetical protein
MKREMQNTGFKVIDCPPWANHGVFLPAAEKARESAVIEAMTGYVETVDIVFALGGFSHCFSSRIAGSFFVA